MTLFDWPFQNRRIHSLWFSIPSRIWICGAGVFIHKYNVWHEFTEIPLIFTERIRGMENNDVFVAGDFGLVAHFNGIHWKIYSEAAGLRVSNHSCGIMQIGYFSPEFLSTVRKNEELLVRRGKIS